MDLGRLITAMVTPLTSDNHLDCDGVRRLVTHLLETGTTAIVVAGTTGESPTLTHAEKLRLLDVSMRAVDGKVPLLAGTGSYNTEETIALSKEVERLGADGLLLVTPYYNRPTQAGLIAHFEAIAEEVEIPIMLYNIPGRTGVRMEVPTLLHLAQIPNIFSVKEASADIAHIMDLCANKPDDFIVYSGDDKFTLPILAVGGQGVVSVASHVVGRELNAMMEAYFSGRITEAAQWNGRLLPIFESLFRVSNPAPVKAALRLLGLPAGGVRLPLLDAPQEVVNEIERELSRLRKNQPTSTQAI